MNSNCIHHWKIDHGGRAQCIKCPATKLFPIYDNLDKFIPVGTLSRNVSEAKKQSAASNIMPIP